MIRLVLAMLLLPGAVAAQSARGFVEVRGAFTPGAEGTTWQLVERVRPTFEANLHDRVALVTTIEAGFSQGRSLQEEFQALIEDSDFGPLLDLANCEWPEHSHDVLRIDRAGDYLSVERLYLDVYLPWLDLRVGRQSLQWGSGQGVNPTDPFPEVLFTEPWKPRKGVNAVRANLPIDPDNDLTLVVAGSDLFDAARVAARYRTRFAGTDLAFVGAYRGDGDGTGMLGLDVRGTNGIGWWVEGALHIEEDRVREEFVLGIDYSFPLLDGLIVMAQYYRNGRPGGAGPAGLGSIHPPDCDLSGVPSAGEDPPSLFPEQEENPNPFVPLFAGSNYLLISLVQRFLPELSLSAVMLQSLDDGTGIVIPTLQASPLGWLDIAVSAQVPYGLDGGGEFKPDDEDLKLSADLGLILGVKEADLSGLLPDATVTVWTRVSF